MDVHPIPSMSVLEYEAQILLPISIAIVCLRCAVRLQATGLRKLRLDDWGMLVAVILFSFTLSLGHLFTTSTEIDPAVNPSHVPINFNPALANNGMTDEYRANLDPASVEYQLRVLMSKLHLAGWSLYVSTLWCLKLCIAVFYTRLTYGLSHTRIRIQIAYVAIGVTYVVVMAILLGACQPFNHYWQISPDPGNQCMPATSKLACYVVVILNVLTDLYLLHIPVLMLLNCQISQMKKVFLIIIFSGAIFVIMAGILRIYFTLTNGRGGGMGAALWGIREAFVAFVIGNVPIIYGGVRIWLRKFRDSKAYARIRSGIKDWPGTKKLGGLFSRAGRGRDRAASGKHTPAKNLAMMSPTGSNSSPLQPGRQSPLQWGHNRSGSRIDTDVMRSVPHCAEMDSECGIQVTRGIRVDVESARSGQSEPETIGTGGKHARTDSEADLAPFSTESPPKKPSRGRGLELPSEERPIGRSILSTPNDPRERRLVTSDGPNYTMWITTDSP